LVVGTLDPAVVANSASELPVHVKLRPAPKLGQTHFEGKKTIEELNQSKNAHHELEA
jgi:hypothetical protein